MDCKKESKRLKIMAHHILVTSKPGMKCAAIRMINAFMINKNRPKVIMVMGSVRIIKRGFTKKFKIPNTNATIIAVVGESTPTPGST